MKYLAVRLCVPLDSLSTEPGKGHQEMMSCEGVTGSKHIPFPFSFNMICSMILLLFCQFYDSFFFHK